MAENENEMRSEELTIRMLRGEERGELEWLAGRDSAQVPTGSVLGAFAGGKLVVAAPIGGGGVVADPFRRTAEVSELLASRVAQLRRGGPRPKLRGVFARRSRAALPSSPPGGGGRLVSPSPPPC